MKKIIIISVIVIAVVALILANVLKKDKGIGVEFEVIEKGTVRQKVTGSGQIRLEAGLSGLARLLGAGGS